MAEENFTPKQEDLILLVNLMNAVIKKEVNPIVGLCSYGSSNYCNTVNELFIKACIVTWEDEAKSHDPSYPIFIKDKEGTPAEQYDAKDLYGDDSYGDARRRLAGHIKKCAEERLSKLQLNYSVMYLAG